MTHHQLDRFFQDLYLRFFEDLGLIEILYLRHVISANGVKVHQEKTHNPILVASEEHIRFEGLPQSLLLL